MQFRLEPGISITRLPANPPSRASRISDGSTPLRRARRTASATPSIVAPITTWLQALTTCPAPLEPTRTTFFPIASSTGSARSKWPASPPTMMLSVPSIAPFSPPDTGASSRPTPLSANRPAISRVTSGEMVLMSMTIVPSAAPWITPFSPSSTSRTSGVSETLVTTNSQPAASSAAESQATAPTASSGSSASGRRA